MSHFFSWGIMGGGFISSQFAKGINYLPGQKIGAVASYSGNKSGIIAERYYQCYEDLVKDEEIDAIYIGTINSEHYKNIKLCLEMGKPVICEKPITLNSRQLEELIELSKNKKVFFMEAMWTRFLPLYTFIKEKFTSGQFGKIEHMQITFGDKATMPKERLLKADLGGGALLDIGVYGISVAEWLLDEMPETIEAQSKNNKDGIDLTTFVQLHYASGCDVEITASIEKKLPNSAIIMTDQGEFVIPYFWRPDMMMCFELNHDFKVDCLINTIKYPLEGNGYQYEALAVEACLKNGEIESKMITQSSSLRVMKIMDQIRKKCGIIYPCDEQV